jgi:KDO2-lipid IV(A) lauroyltransferase
MYYIIYGFLYIVSLLPFPVIYLISDFIFFLLYYVFEYRKKAVMVNLKIAFPEKTQEERKQIAKQFYHNFTDTFLEIIKLISISDKTFAKRFTGNLEIVNELAKKGKNIQLHAGHQFNWEFGSLFMSKAITTIPSYAIYMPINSRPVERLFLKIREKYGTIFVKANEFRTKREEIFSGRFAFFLAADQNPGSPDAAYWQNFFGRPTAFLTGPEVGAIKNNTAVVFVRSKIIKRGYYTCESTLITEDAASTATGDITRAFRDFLEKIIREEPANYLWSHRRWKWEYKDEYKKSWIDTEPNLPE